MNLIALLAPLVLFYAIASDMFTPAISHMPASLDTTTSTVELTLSSFMLAVAFGKLFFGPLSDSIGRVKTILLSISIFTLGSFLCASSPGISLLIIARIIQAFGACGTLVTAYAVLRDHYTEETIGEPCGKLNATLSISALCAPFIGSYLDTTLGWRSIFLFLALIGILTFLMQWYFLQESLNQKNRLPLDAATTSRYVTMLKNKQFLIFSIGAGLGLAVFFLFTSFASYIINNDLHVAEEDFGFYYMPISIAYLLGSLLSAYTCKKYKLLPTLAMGSIIVIIAGGVMFGLYHIIGVTTITFLLPMMTAAVGGALLMTAGIAGSLAPFPKMAGTASALLGFMQFAIASLTGQLAMYSPTQTTAPLGIAIGLVGFIALLLTCLAHFTVARVHK